MAFIDELNIYAKAGKGGDGVVRWRHEKHREFGGPSGGNGGRGGNVYLKAVRNAYLLANYRNKKEFLADAGEPGGANSLFGAAGRDLDILLPIGSIVTNMESGAKIRLDREGERVLLLAGGDGGRGNESFKSSTNQRPKQFTKGTEGQSGEFNIEVELIADIGLIGLPNAGKTSLLNILTNADSKVGHYPFTTLEPNLGDYFGLIIADIPGLIEGAADGKGLGHKFIRHIRRTKMLLHLISLENQDLRKTYKVIRNELKQFDSSLLDKKEIVVLTKTDLVDEKQIKKAINDLKKDNPLVQTLSLYDDDSIKLLRDFMTKEAKSL